MQMSSRPCPPSPVSFSTARTARITSACAGWGRLFAAFVLGLGTAAPVSAQMQPLAEPSRHEDYDFELEPHLVWQWAANEVAQDDGLGLGVRLSMPVIHNGPLEGIDNNIAVGVGLTWAGFIGCRVKGVSCSEHNLWVPLVAQWNFFLRPGISIFGELGLGFRDAIYSIGGSCLGSGCSRSSLEIHPVFWVGGRFRLTSDWSVVARLGSPWLELGGSLTF